MKFKKLLTPIVLLLVLLPLGMVSAADDFEVTLSVENFCGEVALHIDVDAGSGPFTLVINYGDTDVPIEEVVKTFPIDLSDEYLGQGEYEISVKVTDSEGMEGEVEQEISLEGPEVTLESDLFPPLLTLVKGDAIVVFSAHVDGGTEPCEFEWDLDGDGIPENVDPTSSTTEFTFTEAGEYKAKVKVTDGCGFIETGKLNVVVLGDELEESEEGEETEDGEKACHPTAEKIAQAVSSLTGDSGFYNCEEIYDFFRNGFNGSQLGFGQMWRAFRKAEVIKDLSWEEILGWKLEASSWGLLNQLNRFAESVKEVGIGDLVSRVVKGEISVGELRTAMRLTLRYDASFEEALVRIGEGASQGELGQFYKLAQDLEIDPTELDGYLTDGASLTEVRHASKLSDRTGTELDVILAVHNGGSGWGEISKAQRLADEGIDVASILAIGVNEYRKQLREEGRLELLTERDERMTDREERIANQFSEKYGASPEEVMDVYKGECEWKWSCVRAVLRNRAAENASSDGDNRTLVKIANQYGVKPAVVSGRLAVCSGVHLNVLFFFESLHV